MTTPRPETEDKDLGPLQQKFDRGVKFDRKQKYILYANGRYQTVSRMLHQNGQKPKITHTSKEDVCDVGQV